MVNQLELPVLLVAMALAWVFGGDRQFQKWRRGFNAFASRRWLSVGFVGATAFGLSAGMSIISWPEPRIHDEFSYLLAADTFASSRLTNPPHPLWEFFETFHVNVLPTYGSIYPPGQGIFLAVGQRLTGHAVVGVWLSFALACAAVCWMLQAYVPPKWAVLGALLCMVRVGFLGSWAGQQGYWSQSYWGGAVAMLGGALAYGSAARLLRKPSVANSIVLGLGLSALAMSRPYEGLAASIPIIVALSVWLVRNREKWRQMGTVLAPLALVLALSGAWLANYNQEGTGNALRLPYQESAERYSVVPTFVWQSLRPEPAFRHDVIRDYQVNWAGDRYLSKHSTLGYLQDLRTRLAEFAGFYLGVGLLIPLVNLRKILNDGRFRLAACGCGAVILALCLTTWFQPHYAAPLTAPLFALITQGLRQVKVWQRQRGIGAAFVRAVALTYVFLLVVSGACVAKTPRESWHLLRARMQSDFESGPDTHLLFVRYGPGHDCTEEWVYNHADIDRSHVVWARDMGDEANRELLNYYAKRQAWLLDVNAGQVELSPYPSARR